MMDSAAESGYRRGIMEQPVLSSGNIPTAAPGGASDPETQAGRTGWPLGTRILVVEDDPLISMNLVQMLEMLDFEAHSVPRAEAALDWINKNGPPALLLTDLRLPGMNGVALALEVRRGHPDLPVLITTGQSADSLNLPPELTQGVGFLGKPYAMRQLEAAVAQLRR
ncbi:response regulator [Teichococcus vastitatis]|jgi:DNA-binding NtrC family response regulator|uniref:Response regulator n=1 Tax=Teichococcus vastitatis TaxID=2307076 RepID=A0ABS9W4G4_9PROT|nr:response regulator [Pseudoroseomonas vastitatis]MCI0754093.1 response regulator [Pseudoroseomonas vastitatis]